jgi:hypothetical protein
MHISVPVQLIDKNRNIWGSGGYPSVKTELGRIADWLISPEGQALLPATRSVADKCFFPDAEQGT